MWLLCLWNLTKLNVFPCPGATRVALGSCPPLWSSPFPFGGALFGQNSHHAGRKEFTSLCFHSPPFHSLLFNFISNGLQWHTKSWRRDEGGVWMREFLASPHLIKTQLHHPDLCLCLNYGSVVNYDILYHLVLLPQWCWTVLLLRLQKRQHSKKTQLSEELTHRDKEVQGLEAYKTLLGAKMWSWVCFGSQKSKFKRP